MRTPIPPAIVSKLTLLLFLSQKNPHQVTYICFIYYVVTFENTSSLSTVQTLNSHNPLVQKQRRLTFPLSEKKYVSEVDVEDAIRSIGPTKPGIKISSSMVVEQLGILVDIDRKKILHQKLNNYVSDSS